MKANNECMCYEQVLNYLSLWLCRQLLFVVSLKKMELRQSLAWVDDVQSGGFLQCTMRLKKRADFEFVTVFKIFTFHF